MEVSRTPCNFGLPLNSSLELHVTFQLCVVLLVCPPTQCVACVGGPKSSFSNTWNRLVNHFCNFSLPLSSVLQVCFAPQLCVVLIGCLCTMRCSCGWPNKPIFRNIEFARTPILQCWFAPKLGFTSSCCPSALWCTPTRKDGSWPISTSVTDVNLGITIQSLNAFIPRQCGRGGMRSQG
jgi:hypothetical protein